MSRRRVVLDDDFDLINLIDLLVSLTAVLLVLMPARIPALAKLMNTLPTTAQGTAESASEPATTVAFDASGNITWDDEPVDWTELTRRTAAHPPTQPIQVAGANDAPYGVSVRVRLALQKTGCPLVELARLTPEEISDAPAN